MMFYAEDPKFPEATIHNVYTGITYRLEMVFVEGEQLPEVWLVTADGRPTTAGRRLFRGDSAVEFWRMLLFCNPWAGSLSPHKFLKGLLGESEPETSGEDGGIPF